MKRSRSVDEDCEECLPISKRINRLHIQSRRNTAEEQWVQNVPSNSAHTMDTVINNWNGSPESSNSLQPCSSTSGQTTTETVMQLPCPTNNYNTNPYLSNGNNCDLIKFEANTNFCDVNFEDLQGYNPELTMTDNPHYFQMNNLLYDLHVSRIYRCKSSNHRNLDDSHL